jgi:hypothetical protein
MSTRMKKFAGTKGLLDIKRQCKAAGVAYDDYRFRKVGADYVCLGVATGTRPDRSPFVLAGADGNPRGGFVMFNTFNGTFYGMTDKGVEFDSGSTKHEREPWFQALLSFFYIEKGEPGAEKQPATMVDYTLGGTALLRKK